MNGRKVKMGGEVHEGARRAAAGYERSDRRSPKVYICPELQRGVFLIKGFWGRDYVRWRD